MLRRRLDPIHPIAVVIALLSLAILGYAIFYIARQSNRKNEYLGEYYMGYQAHGCILSIKNDSNFSLTWVSWTPDAIKEGREFKGTYRIEGNSIRLSLFKDSFGESSCLVPSMVLVRWQDRKYLFYDRDEDDSLERSKKIRSDFCARVESGEELRREQTESWFAAYIEINDKLRLQGGDAGTSDSSPVLIDGTFFCSGEIP